MVTFLVIRFAPLEEILLATPVFRHLKKQVKNARVLLLTGEDHAGLLKTNPHIDHVHEYSGNFKSCLGGLKEESIDYIIDLQRNGFSARIKFRLKRMDFTIKRKQKSRRQSENQSIQDRIEANLESIRYFISEKDNLGPELYLTAGQKDSLSSLPEKLRKDLQLITVQ